MEKQIRQGLQIYYCGHEKCTPGHSFGPAVREHYLMHFVLRGRGSYQVKGKSFSIGGGEAFLIFPGEVTYYEADRKEPWEYVWIAFGGEEAQRLLCVCRLEGDRYVCRFAAAGGMEEYLMKILALFQLGREPAEALLGYFYLVWSEIEREADPVDGPFDVKYLNQAKAYIRHNYSYPVSVAEMARHIGIDRTYLYRIFVRYEGKSPKQYLTEYRVEAAANMLRYTKMPVTGIAYSCGFSDTSVFCRQFRRQKGESPQRFRDALVREADPLAMPAAQEPDGS